MEQAVSKMLETIPTDEALWLIVCFFILLDVIAGTTRAILEKNVSSEKARKGVQHKAGYFIVMLLAMSIDIAQQILDLGFQLPILGVCSAMIVVTEIFSLCEHIKALNPQINLDFLEDAKEVPDNGENETKRN